MSSIGKTVDWKDTAQNGSRQEVSNALSAQKDITNTLNTTTTNPITVVYIHRGESHMENDVDDRVSVFQEIWQDGNTWKIITEASTKKRFLDSHIRILLRAFKSFINPEIGFPYEEEFFKSITKLQVHKICDLIREYQQLQLKLYFSFYINKYCFETHCFPVR